MRAFLGVPNRTEQLADVPKFMRRFWHACPTRACGFKLLNAQIRPIDKAAQIFAGDESETGAAAVPVRRLLLERADISAEFDSWRRAQSTGNWGTSPEAQARFGTAAATGKQNGSSPGQAHTQPLPHMAFRGCRGCDPEAVARNQAMANAIGPARFAYQHRAWFKFAREVAAPDDAPLLHLYSENLTRSLAECNRTMARVYSFLELPPLRENCNVSAVPMEWPCDIQNDPHCSLEKYEKASAHD